MPESTIKKRSDAKRWRTITVGTGKNKRVLHVAIVRNAGKSKGVNHGSVKG